MPPKEENGTDGDVDEAFKVFERKMGIEERLITTHQQVLFLRRDMTRLEKAVQFKDTCDANHRAEEVRIIRVEGDVKELKEGNYRNLGTGLAIVALILAVVIPIATVFMH